MTDRQAAIARVRWRAAEDQLYPALIADPDRYRLALHQVQAVVAELRRRGDDVAALLDAEASAEEVLASVAGEELPGSGLPARLLVGAACAIRDREIGAAP